MTQALPVKGKLDGSASPTVAEYQAAIGFIWQYLNDLMGADGTNKTALSTLGALAASQVKKSAAYTVVAADRGKVIICEGTSWTLGLPDISVVGGGFPLIVWSRASGTITLDGSGTQKLKSNYASDTANGDLTLNLAAGDAALLVSQDDGGGVVYWTAPFASAILRTAAVENALIGWDFNTNSFYRGNSWPAVGSGQYVANRVRCDYGTSAVVTVSRSTNVPSVAQAGKLISYSLKAAVTTADASVAAADIFVLREFIEGVNFGALLAQRSFVASGWVYSNKTGTFCVFGGNEIDRSYTAEVVINAANTWEFKRDILFTPSPSAGTWNYGNQLGLTWGVCLMAGSNYQMTANTWNAVNKFATANQTNFLDTVGNSIEFADWKVHAGTVSIETKPRTQQETDMLCRRYGRVDGSARMGKGDSGTNVAFGFNFSDAPMRAAPTASLKTTTPTVRGNSADITAAGSTIVFSSLASNGGFVIVGGFAGLTAGDGYVERNLTDFIQFDAEL